MTKILICDDDEKFCDLLSEKIKNAGKKLNTDFEIDTVNSFAELEEEKETADILFLDVMINGKNMIDKLAEAGAQKNAEVLQTVIITSFPGEIYNISSIKPDWYIDKIKMTDKHIEQCLDNCIKSLKSKKQKLIVTLPNKLNFLINLKDVLYFEAQNKTTVFHLANGKEIMTVAKFGDIIKKVGINFQQCSRSYAVNFYYIVAFKWHKYILSDNTEITISRSSYGKMVNEYKSFVEN